MRIFHANGKICNLRANPSLFHGRGHASPPQRRWKFGPHLETRRKGALGTDKVRMRYGCQHGKRGQLIPRRSILLRYIWGRTVRKVMPTSPGDIPRSVRKIRNQGYSRGVYGFWVPYRKACFPTPPRQRVRVIRRQPHRRALGTPRPSTGHRPSGSNQHFMTSVLFPRICL